MNHSIHVRTPHRDRHRLKDLQFAVGVVVAVGGAAVLLSEFVRLFA